MLTRILGALTERGVEIRGDARTCSLYPAAKSASDDDFDREYLAAIISVKIVDTLDEGLAPIIGG